jgi:nicotinamidase-related amidase
MSTVQPAAALRIDPARAVLLVVDVQDKLHAVMQESLRKDIERTVPILAEAARRFGIPVVASQQYPRGLGPTIPVVEQSLAELGERLWRLDKLEFSACDAPGFEDAWRALGRDQWIVVGMEAHVCVYQSVRSLLGRGASVHVPRDAVASRTVDNRDVGLALMERAGGIVTATEVVVFDLLGRAGTEDFKALSRLIR